MLKLVGEPWMAWLSWLGVLLQSERFHSGHPRAWVVAQYLAGVPVRGNQSMFLSHIIVLLPLFLPPSLSLKINKIF